MSVLVTGASGFIGGSVTDALSAAGEQVVVLSRRAQQYDKSVVQAIGDIGGELVSACIFKIEASSVDAIIHCAAVTPWSGEVDYSLDLVMAKNVAMLSKRLGVNRVIHISGWNVYDMSQSAAPYDESTALQPETEYGKSKLAVETYFQQELPGVVTSVRLASVYGPGQVSPGLITGLVARAENGETLVINARTTRRDYVYIDDVALALVALAHSDEKLPAALNVGSGGSVSVEEVAHTIKDIYAEAYSRSLTVSVSEVIQESSIVDNSLDITQAVGLGLGMLGETTFSEGLRTYIEWVRDAAIH